MGTMDPSTQRLADLTSREAARRDRQVKIALLGTSVATIAVLVLAAVQENFRPAWRRHQLEYGKLLQARATDDWGRTLAASYLVELRQIVVPELGATDRCVSCHVGYDDPRMADLPNPYRTHPGPYLRWHEDTRYGCTICHRGQGSATSFADAKADDRHWDYPLLPRELTQSSCGVCHTPDEVETRGGEVYALGAALFEVKGCRSCHRLEGRGGGLGPALDNEGLKVKGQLPFAAIDGPHTLPQWLEQHFDDPQRVVPGSQMPTPGLNRSERTALTTFLLSLQQRDLPRSYLSPRKHLAYYRQANPEPRTGEQLYATYCSTCHDTGGLGRWDKLFARFIPAIRAPTYRRHADPAYVAANIREGRQGTLMAAFGPAAGGLSEEEIRLLTGHLLGREVQAAAIAPSEGERVHPRAQAGSVARGAALFRRECSGCHGAAAEGKLGPSLIAPVFQRMASDEFLYATISEGRPQTAMPAFLAPGHGGMAPQDIDDLIAWLRSLAAPQPARVAAVATQAAHAREGR